MPETRIGEYKIRSGNADEAFWRLAPGTNVNDIFYEHLFPIAPNDSATSNTLTLPPRFGIFDIVVRMSEPVVESQLSDAQSVDLLTISLAGQPLNTPMPMWDDGTGSAENRVANICFAVRIPNGQNQFEGTLELTSVKAGVANAGTKTVRLPIRIGEYERAADLFVFFIATPRIRKPGPRYCWSKGQIVDWSAMGPYAPLSGADVDAKIFRDNRPQGFRHRNRRVPLRSDAQGFPSYQHPNGERTVLAFPTRWPLIFTVTSGGYVKRAHLVRLEHANIDHNLNPHLISEIKVIANGVAGAQIATKTVLADPGHGVVYAFTGARRSQEWFVAHRIATRIGEILRDRFAFPANNFFMTRTAGFGLIDPGELNLPNAPERGARRFVFDIAGRRVRARQAARSLTDISNLVLTGDDDTPANIAEADRNRLINNNNATINAIIARINLPAGQRVQPGSVRWHVPTSDYVYRVERHPPVPGQNPIIDDARHLPINTNDWFTLDAAMLQNLVRRTARWSMALELGGGNIPADAATGRPAFTPAARAAMQAHNAEDYMRRKIIEELDLEEPYAAGAVIPNQYRNKETMGWHFRVRRDYINRKRCDIAVSIHENAMGPNALSTIGMVMLVSQNPPQYQMLAAKMFMKYTDPFDQGYRRGGIVGHNAGQLSAQNTRRGNHAYFELEFMTSTIVNNPGVRAANPSRYQYQDMVENNFINNTAEQIVAGIIEFLVDQQSDIINVSYDGSNLLTW